MKKKSIKTNQKMKNALVFFVKLNFTAVLNLNFMNERFSDGKLDTADNGRLKIDFTFYYCQDIDSSFEKKSITVSGGSR